MTTAAELRLHAIARSVPLHSLAPVYIISPESLFQMCTT